MAPIFVPWTAQASRGGGSRMRALMTSFDGYRTHDFPVVPWLTDRWVDDPVEVTLLTFLYESHRNSS